MEPEPSPQAPLPDAPASPGTKARPRPKHRRRHYDTEGTLRRGRMWIAVIFCAFRLLDAVVVLLLKMLPEGSEQKYLYLYIILTGLWTTALLVAIWLRQAWARYVLVGLLIAIPVAEGFLLPRISLDFGGATIDPVLTGSILLYACIAGLLILLKPIRRLTSQSYT